MSKTQVTLLPLKDEDREQFIKDNQKAFKYGATEEFGMRDEHFEEEGEIISRRTIECCIDEGTAYRIRQNGQSVGGAVIRTEYDCGELELLFEPDVETVKDQMMVCAFRTEGLTESDMKEVARFKQVVLEYMKMQKMLGE